MFNQKHHINKQNQIKLHKTNKQPNNKPVTK